MKRCMECSIKESERAKIKHDARAKAGLCVRCGAPVEDEGRLTCRTCREHQKRYNARNAAAVRQLAKAEDHGEYRGEGRQGKGGQT
jgi:hypothetical protein